MTVTEAGSIREKQAKWGKNQRPSSVYVRQVEKTNVKNNLNVRSSREIARWRGAIKGESGAVCVCVEEQRSGLIARVKLCMNISVCTLRQTEDV